MVPTDQRLRAEQLAVGEPDQRLIEKLELGFLERLAQLGLVGAPCDHGAAQARLEELVASRARGLGALQRKVGVGQQLLGTRSLLGTDRHPDIDAHMDRLAAERERRGEELHDVLGVLAGPRAVGHQREEEGKLVRAHARQRRAGSEMRPQPLRGLAQDQVGRDVAERVVHVLEAEEIDQKQRSCLLRHRLLQPLDQEGAIGKTGDRIEMRQSEQALLALLAIGDIAQDRRKAHVVVLVPHGQRQLGGKLFAFAVLGDEPDLLGAGAQGSAIGEAHELGRLQLSHARRKDEPDGLAHGLLRGIAEQRLGRLVPIVDATRGVGADDRIGRRRGDALEAQLAFDLGAVEAAQLQLVHDEVGDILEVLAVVVGELGPGLGVENAQCADLLARGCRQRNTCVEADLRRLCYQWVSSKPLILARVGHQKQAVAFDRIGAEASFPADPGGLHPIARLEVETLLADE